MIKMNIHYIYIYILYIYIYIIYIILYIYILYIYIYIIYILYIYYIYPLYIHYISIIYPILYIHYISIIYPLYIHYVSIYCPHQSGHLRWMPKDRTEQVNIRHGHCCAHRTVVTGRSLGRGSMGSPGRSSGQSDSWVVRMGFCEKVTSKGGNPVATL